ncbi:MAG: isoprenylcysteine carboxylmethyltransferase family protein [Candidatus Margulisbacteria bacterium]|nr:isoprenylcysteine carboxylmethyltransferase family protein [Candidatus Margulisiibacteriota bacterium]
MTIQVLLLALFAANLALIWLAQFQDKFKWYRFLGAFILVVLPLASVFFQQPVFELDYFWWRIAGVIAIILGLGLIVWAKLTVASLPAEIGQQPKKLRTEGPYAFVRHPIYLGLIFVFVGWWWAAAAVYSFYFGMVILAMIWIEAYLEEKLLLEKIFGAEFIDYRRRTGMFWIK